MSKDTKIQWTDSTVNCTMGCDGCELWNKIEHTCYAGKLHDRYGGRNSGFSPTFDQLTFYPGRMAKAAGWCDLTGTTRVEKPWLSGLPRHIFVSDMSDALSKAVTFEFLKNEIIDVVNSEKGHRHIWMWLTKQAGRMAHFNLWLKDHGLEWPDNLMPGTSITTQRTTPRIDNLLRVGNEHTTRFLSVEPMREEIDLSNWIQKLDLVIVGGESGSDDHPCHVEWIDNIISQCKAAGVACFVKQLGQHVRCDDPEFGEQRIMLKDSHGGDWSEWPEDLRIRQMPAQFVPAADAEGE